MRLKKDKRDVSGEKPTLVISKASDFSHPLTHGSVIMCVKNDLHFTVRNSGGKTGN